MEEKQKFSYSAAGAGVAEPVNATAPMTLPERTREQIERAARAEGQKAYDAAKKSIEEAAHGRTLSEEQLKRAYDAAQAEGRRIYALAKKTYTERAYEAMRRTAELEGGATATPATQSVAGNDTTPAPAAPESDDKTPASAGTGAAQPAPPAAQIKKPESAAPQGDREASPARKDKEDRTSGSADPGTAGDKKDAQQPTAQRKPAGDKPGATGFYELDADALGPREHEAPRDKRRKGKDSGEQVTKKKKKKGGLIVLIILLLLLVAAGTTVGLFYTGVLSISMFDNYESGYTYEVDSYDTLMSYLNHPSLKASDTLALSGSYTVDVQEEFDGFVQLPLCNVTGGSVTFTGGTVYMAGGESACSAEGVKFSDCEVYINAPNTALTGAGFPDSDTVNVASLNGTDHLREWTTHFAGERFTVSVSYTNVSGSAVDGATATLSSPGLLFVNGGSLPISGLAAGATAEAEVEVVALEGGSHTIQTAAYNDAGNLLVFGESAPVTVMGRGFRSGDIHTHSAAGVSSREGTVQENVLAAYENGLDFIVSVENGVEEGIEAERLDQSEVDAIVGGSDRFLQLTGAETGIDLRHMLIYNSDVRPDSEYVADPYKQWSMGDALNEALDAGAIVYLPHLFDYGDLSEMINTGFSLRRATAFELMSRLHEHNSMEVKVAFNLWNNLLSYGQHVYGYMASNNFDPETVGARYIRGILSELTEEEIWELLQNGNYFSSNGPELRLTIGGVGIGDTLVIDDTTAGTANIYASHTSPLTTVTLYRYPITGEITDLAPELVFSEDYTGKGVYSISETVELTLNPREYYRLEVHSEQDEASDLLGYEDIGLAFSNPIWVMRGSANGYASLDSLELEMGGTIHQADDGTYYILKDHLFLYDRLLETYTGGALHRQYHSFNTEGLADYISYAVYSPDGEFRSIKVYVIDAPVGEE